jgi:hypothetical protein
MATLNANIPYQRCLVRNEYLFNFEKTGTTPCYLFGIKSTLNHPMRFHCQIDNGALFWSLPISAFVWKTPFEKMGSTEQKRLSNLQWWDCQSNDIAITCFSFLEGYKADYRSRNKRWHKGTYLFSIDNYFADLNQAPLGYAADPDSKIYHFLQLDNGNYCLSPNNYLRWHNKNFVDPYDLKNPPRYKASDFGLRAEGY